MMTKTAKAGEEPRKSHQHSTEDDVLHFLSRTLQAHNLDGESQGALEKLRTLMIALEKQETTLSNWPDSPSKARICGALAKARDTVSRVVADLARRRPENGGRDIHVAKAI
jgi:hypothetical protein